MNISTTFAKTIWRIFISAALMVGIAFILLTTLPFDAVKSCLDTFPSDGDLESFTPAVQAQLSPAKWIGIVLVAAAGLTGAARKKTQPVVGNILVFVNRAWGIFIEDIRAMFSALRSMEMEKWHGYLLGVIFLLGIINSATFLSRPMRYDEAYTFNIFASRPMLRIISDYHLPNNHIFHSILVHFAYRLFGNQPWVVRLPAFVAGIALVPAGYLAARAFFNAEAAILASSMIAFFPILVNYSTNARGYTLMTLCTLLLMSLGTYVKFHRNRAAWALMIVVSTLGFYTVPTMLYPFGAIGLWLLLSWLSKDTVTVYDMSFIKRLFILGILTVLLVFVLYTPVFIVNGLDQVFSNTFVEALEWGRFWKLLTRRFKGTWTVFNKGVPRTLTWSLVIGFGAALFLRHKNAQHKVAFPLVLVFFSGAVVVIQRVAPFDRMWLFAVPIFLIWAAAGLVYIYENTIGKIMLRWPTALVITKLGFMLLLSLPLMWTGATYHHKRDAAQAYAQEITLYLRDILTPDDVVVITFPDDAPIRYYFDFYNLDDGDFFSYQASDFQRVVVLVNEPRGQTIESVLEKQDFPVESVNVQAAERVGQHSHITIYALARR